jgi:hypothetical protein
MLPHCTKNRHFRAIAYPSLRAENACAKEASWGRRGQPAWQYPSTTSTPLHTRPKSYRPRSYLARILRGAPERHRPTAHQEVLHTAPARHLSPSHQGVLRTAPARHLHIREYSAPPPGGKYPTPKPFPPNQTSQNPRPTPHEKLATYPRKIRDPRLTDFSASC